MTQRYYSNIYWHFTGSPSDVDWGKVSNPKEILEYGEPSDPKDAADVVKKILGSKKLLGTAREVIADELETDPFCCVTDIPLKDLIAHAPYYGKVAIGFEASDIHSNFIPVLYIPKQSLPATTKTEPNKKILKQAYDFLSAQGSFAEQQGMKLLSLAQHHGAEKEVPDGEQIRGFLSSFIKVTDFDTDPSLTFYREREWRHIGDYEFNENNVSAIVAPENMLGELKEHVIDTLKYPNTISFVSWEFIENS